MTAIPVTANAARPPATDGFRAELAALERRYVGLWDTIGEAPPRLGEPVTRRRQFANARAARRLVDRLAREVEGFPTSEPQRRTWRQRVSSQALVLVGDEGKSFVISGLRVLTRGDR